MLQSEFCSNHFLWQLSLLHQASTPIISFAILVQVDGTLWSTISSAFEFIFHIHLISRVQHQISKSGMKQNDIEAEENDKMDPEYDPKAEKRSNGGRPREDNFANLGPKMKRKRLEESRVKVKIVAKENNLTNIQTVAELGRQLANEEGDREKAKMFEHIVNEENPLAHRKMPVEQATAIKVF